MNYDGGGNGASCGGIKVRTDTTELSDMVIARFGDGRNLVGKGKVFVKDEAKVESRVRSFVLLESAEYEFTLGGIESLVQFSSVLCTRQHKVLRGCTPAGRGGFSFHAETVLRIRRTRARSRKVFQMNWTATP